MTWSTSEIEYEGFPLLLRKPDYDNIWQHRKKLTQLVSIEHLLEEVMANGLPKKAYNKSLSDFDHYMCTIFEGSQRGIIFLIETFAGKRNYHYYTLPQYKMTEHVDEAKNKFSVDLEVSVNLDPHWGFFDAYPVVLFK